MTVLVSFKKRIAEEQLLTLVQRSLVSNFAECSWCVGRFDIWPRNTTIFDPVVLRLVLGWSISRLVDVPPSKLSEDWDSEEEGSKSQSQVHERGIEVIPCLHHLRDLEVRSIVALQPPTSLDDRNVCHCPDRRGENAKVRHNTDAQDLLGQRRLDSSFGAWDGGDSVRSMSGTKLLE